MDTIIYWIKLLLPIKQNLIMALNDAAKLHKTNDVKVTYIQIHNRHSLKIYHDVGGNMQKKIKLTLLIILIGIGVIIGYLTYNEYDSKVNVQNQDVSGGYKTMIEVSSTSPYPLDEIIHEVKTRRYSNDYDNQTLSWMESLKQKNVFISNNTYVIMNDEDASKVHHSTVDITDVYIVENIECYVIENRSLGDDKSHDVLLVKNVTDLGNKTYYYEV